MKNGFNFVFEFQKTQIRLRCRIHTHTQSELLNERDGRELLVGNCFKLCKQKIKRKTISRQDYIVVGLIRRKDKERLLSENLIACTKKTSSSVAAHPERLTFLPFVGNFALVQDQSHVKYTSNLVCCTFCYALSYLLCCTVRYYGIEIFQHIIKDLFHVMRIT